MDTARMTIGSDVCSSDCSHVECLLSKQRCLLTFRFTRLSLPGVRTWNGLALFEIFQHLHYAFAGQVFEIDVVDFSDRSVGASTRAFNLLQGVVTISVVVLHKVLRSGKNILGTVQHTSNVSTDTNVALADWLSLEHCVERCNFVNTHWRNLTDLSNFVHHTDGAEPVLVLAQVKQRHDGTLLVLWRILCEYLLNLLLVFIIKGKWSLLVVHFSVSMDTHNVVASDSGNVGSTQREGSWYTDKSSKHSVQVELDCASC